MRFNYAYVALFFLSVAGLGALLFPTYFDVALIHRNSYLYSTALVMLEDLDRRGQDPRVDLERARVLFLVGRFNDAVEVLQDLTRRQPDHVEAWRRLAQTYRAADLPRQAMSSLERLRAVAPADSQALYLLDEYYQWFQQTERAVDNLEAIVDLFPEDVRSQERLVDLYLRTGRGDDAAAMLERVSSATPEGIYALYDLGSLYLSRRDPRAVDVYRRLDERWPDRDDIVDGLVAALVLSGRYDEAEAQFDAHYASRLAPALLARRKAQLRLSMGDRVGALAAFREAHERDPRIGVVRDLAELYGAEGDPAAAALWAERWVQQQPELRAAWSEWVAWLATARQRRPLIEALRAYLQRWPDDDGRRLELADAFQWIEAYADEARTLEELLRRRPADVGLRLRLASAWTAAGRPAAAVTIYASLLADGARPDIVTGLLDAAEALPALSPEACSALELAAAHVGELPWEPRLRLAATLDACGRAAAASALFADTAGRLTDEPGPLARVGQQLAESGRSRWAIEVYRQVLARDPESQAALSGLAGLLVETEPGLALDHLRRLRRLRPDDGDVAYRLGLTFEALGDSAGMTAAYRDALALTPVTVDSEYAARRRAHALARTGDRATALALLDDARVRFPRAWGIRNDGAALLLDGGRADEALRWLAEVPAP